MKLSLKQITSLLIIMFSICLAASSADIKFDFGDLKSHTLTSKAWEAYTNKNDDALNAYINKCIKLYSKKALEQQQELTQLPDNMIAQKFWALNDVGTCLFIQAKSLFDKSQFDAVQKQCEMIKQQYSYAQCFETKTGIYWRILDASKDLVMKITYKNIDFEDYTSEILTKKAWQMLNEGRTEEALIYSQKCLALYEKNASKQQKDLIKFPSKNDTFNYWALNDIGTCLFIAGEAHMQEQEWKQAMKFYKKLVEKYNFSQCWDARGWFWKPALSARGKLNKIRAEQGVY